MKWEQIVTTCI